MEGLIFYPLSPWERARVRVRTTAVNQPEKFKMTYVVFDTDVVIRALIFNNSVP